METKLVIAPSKHTEIVHTPGETNMDSILGAWDALSAKEKDLVLFARRNGWNVEITDK